MDSPGSLGISTMRRSHWKSKGLVRAAVGRQLSLWPFNGSQVCAQDHFPPNGANNSISSCWWQREACLCLAQTPGPGGDLCSLLQTNLTKFGKEQHCHRDQFEKSLVACPFLRNLFFSFQKVQKRTLKRRHRKVHAGGTS